jgi:hypothetical protein
MVNKRNEEVYLEMEDNRKTSMFQKYSQVIKI